MESNRFIIATDILEILAKEGMDASRKEVLSRIQKIQEEILENCLTRNKEPFYTTSLNDLANTRPYVPDETLIWLKNNWETAISDICKAVTPQSLETESSVFMYDRCISSILMAIDLLFEGSIMVKRLTVSHIGQALSILINRVTTETEEIPIFTLGVLSKDVCNVITRILKESEGSFVEDTDCISNHQSYPLRDYQVQLQKHLPHSVSFITHADDSYGALYKLVEWGHTNPALLTAVCSNIYLFLRKDNNCI